METDYISSKSSDLKIQRFYNSILANYDNSWGFENNWGSITTDKLAIGGLWQSNYSAKIIKPYSNYSRLALRPDGKILAFTLNSQGKYVPDLDIQDTLTPIKDTAGAITGWRYLVANTQVTETYNANGQLISTTNKHGIITQTLTYNTNNLLQNVTDMAGRQLTFNYDNNKRVTSITLPDSGQLQYAYNTNGMLESVTYPDNNKRTYHYENSSFPTHLTGITDENNKRFATFSYDGQGRAISTEHAGGVEKYSVVYNSDGSSTVTDALGASRTYTFTTVQGTIKLATLTQPCNTCNGGSQKTTYDANGNVDSRLDFKGNLTKYTYDLSRNLETKRVEGLKADGTTTAQTRTTTTEWHTTLRSPKRMAKPRQIITYVYNGDNGITCGATGALCSKTIQETNDTNGSLGFTATVTTTPARTWTYTYNTSGQLLTVDGARTDVVDKTNYTYYADTTTTHRIGDLWKITNALGHITTFDSYDANGRPLSITNSNGITTTLTYSARGLLKTTTVAGNTTTSYTYDNNQLLSKVTYPDGREYTYSYDDAHRVTSITSKTGEKTSYTLDLLGNHLTETTTNATGVITQSLTQEFNNLSQLQKTIISIQGNNATTQYAYDNNGNIANETSALGDVTTYSYDALNRLASEQVAADSKTLITQYGINAQNLPETTKSPNNTTTTKTYNGFGEVLTEISPDRGTTTYTYDTAGNLKTRKDARNITLTYSYDALNRLTQITSSTNTIDTVSYIYDANGTICTNGKGRLCKVTDSSGITEYAYNSDSLLSRKTITVAGYVYNTVMYSTANGRPVLTSFPGTRYLKYIRDSEGRLSKLTTSIDPTQNIIFSNATYRPDELLTAITYGNGVTFQNTYDTSGHRTKTMSTGIAPTNVVEDYTWNLEGDFTKRVTSGANNVTHNFIYDGFSRLKQETGTPIPQSFTYDDNGNRLSNGANTYAYVLNTNRLQSRNTALPTLDSGGNTLTNGLGQTYTWDSFGRLLSVATTAGTTQYQYNYLNQRVSKTLSNGTKTIYHYDNNGRLVMETSSMGVMQAWYLYNDNSDLVAIIYGANSPYNATAQEQVLYIHSDHLGTPRIATDAIKRLVWRWESDAFGNTTPIQDYDGDGKATIINLRFPGQYYDAESKLHYNWNRYYDPLLGRYISSDPIGLEGGLNTFGYVSNNPIIRKDINGLWGIDWNNFGPREWKDYDPNKTQKPKEKCTYLCNLTEDEADFFAAEKTIDRTKGSQMRECEFNL